MNKYIKLLRFDYWIKQFFIFPGMLIAFVLIDESFFSVGLCLKTVIGLFAISLVASSNYVINEWLDVKTDCFHPQKRNRVAVTNTLNPKIIYSLYFGSFCLGLVIGKFVSTQFAMSLVWLWIMGILYNVKPFRTKDIAYVDIYSESINNAIRFLAGWYIVTDTYYPPISVVLGYWFAGAFLMSMKRFAEYRVIDSSDVAIQYRNSFKNYSEQKLLIIAFFNAMLSVLFIGVFFVKYRIELILFMPFYIGLFCYYVHISFQDNSAAQSPEKLYKEKGLIVYVFILFMIFALTMLIDISVIEKLLSNKLIQM